MSAILCRQTLRTIFALAPAGACIGCFRGTASPPSAASGTHVVASAVGSTNGASEGSTIVGTVLLSTTGKPPASGGVVYLEDAPKQAGVATTATIDVHHKEFSPFISVVTTGGTVTFGNEDALAHHVFSPDVPKWDTGYLQKNGTASRVFESPGAIALLCNIHPEMLSYLLVIPSTYFGKLSADGKYSIGNVPAGVHRATAWSPRTPMATQSVTAGSSGAVTSNFDLHPDVATK